jgi:hypothetical protein
VEAHVVYQRAVEVENHGLYHNRIMWGLPL